MKPLRSALALVAVLTCSTAMMAEVSLPKVLGSHMVIQRGQPVHVWGDASPGEKVSVEFHGAKGEATADAVGRWSVYLAPQPAGGPYTLTVQGTNTITLDDILVGDLWFASGQSNMEMPLAGFGPDTPVKNGEQEIAAANYPQMRLLRVDKKGATYPLEDIVSGTPWQSCTPETARQFSAVAYFFGRDLLKHEKVPIGLIDSTWGGTPAATWVSLDTIGADASLMPVYAAYNQLANGETTQARHEALDKIAIAKGQPPAKRGWHPDLVSYAPASLYNAMVAPFTPMPIKGVIWYQGETDSSMARNFLYKKLFPSLIQDWRQHWQEPDMPFLYVQLSSFTSTPQEVWPIVREAQRTTLALRNTGMAVTTDIGKADNVHPPDKETVGARLALWARATVYGEKLEYSGPLFEQANPEGATIKVWFTHAEGMQPHGTLTGFEVAGADRKFVPATGQIQGETIIVSSPSVPEPKYVRYGWQNYTDANLYNNEGLPASPFTSIVNPE
ncbi:sialate O-acetylesterase [Silvibacterium acidisoli]|uniref:sialate O-acetylesterase n=1 Tax=Acidobacteriaceae bacterium ZG23-2 TaxID=2883246 RepID=UPI00406D1E6D